MISIAPENSNFDKVVVHAQGGLPACEAKLDPGDGVNGRALSYADNGNGTFTDNNTLLIWEEKKVGSGDVHDVNNTYTWSNTSTAADGTVFTDFLATLNTPPCFAKHCDWRLPNVKELVSLLDYGELFPTIAASVPGATQNWVYWSVTTVAAGGLPSLAWTVGFEDGSVNVSSKSTGFYVRAVRNGK